MCEVVHAMISALERLGKKIGIPGQPQLHSETFYFLFGEPLYPLIAARNLIVWYGKAR